MKRYLLFDSGCGGCTDLARAIEREAKGWLTARSLREKQIQDMLNEAHRGWTWEPTLLETDGVHTSIFTGTQLSVKLAIGIGPQASWRVLRLLYSLNGAVEPDSGRRNFLRQGGIVMASLAVLGLPGFRIGRESHASWQAGDLSTYLDPEYGFSVTYPTQWPVSTMIQQPIPAKYADAIIKRVRFSIPSVGLVDLDVWLSHGLDLDAWIQNYLITRPVQGLTSKPNAMVAAQPSVVFSHSGNGANGAVDMLFAFFAYKEYVFRLAHMTPTGMPPLQAFLDMLDTFTLPGGISAKANIPQQIRENATQIGSGQVTPLVPSCCGYSSPGNPFPCCTNGNCTWWVYRKFKTTSPSVTIPFNDNASEWWTEVPDFMYLGWYSQTANPSANRRNIAWWGVVLPDMPTGHVAFAANYTGGGTINITEMLCDKYYCVRTRNNMDIHLPYGYIFKA